MLASKPESPGSIDGPVVKRMRGVAIGPSPLFPRSALDRRPSAVGLPPSLGYEPRGAPTTSRHAPDALGKAGSYRLKRVLDVVVSTLALLFLGPLMMIVALLIWIFDPGPVIFSQDRIGRGGQPFKIFKFRSMYVNADDLLAKTLARDPHSRAEWLSCQKLQRDPRVTPLGRFLRLSSIDELPQLFNVLRGDMSLVGPRPIVDAERSRYGRHIHHYCMVSPGITGLWQVSGRNDTSYERRVAMDVMYSRRASLRLDLWILAMTIPAVVRAEGCY